MNIKAIIIALVIVVVGLGGWYVISRQGADEPAVAEAPAAEAAVAEQSATAEPAATEDTATEEPAADTAEPAAEDGDFPRVVAMIEGNPDAKVHVIEYASFTCPHCARFMGDQYVQIKANYIDTGLISWEYRDVYFDRFGLWAALIARCGGPLRFFGITDIIYKQQSEWIAGGDPTLIAQNLRNIGKVAGLDDAMLNQCMNDEEMAQQLVDWYTANQEKDPIEGTPEFRINGEKYTNMSYEEFAAILDEKLAE